MTSIQAIQSAALLTLLALSAFFSGAETALMSVSKIRIRNMVDKGIPKARLVYELLVEPGRLLSALLIGNNIVNIVSSSIGTVFFISLFGPVYGVPIAAFVMTILVLVFGEIVPKTLANVAAERWALRVVTPVRTFMRVFSPVIGVFVHLTRVVMKLTGNSGHPTLLTEDEIRTVISLGHKEGVLDPEERDMLTGILEFNDTLAREIMIPRLDIFGLELSTPVKEAAKLAAESQYSRIPVYQRSIDSIVGVIHVKDLLNVLTHNPNIQSLKQILREPLLIPENMKISRLLSRMQKQKASVAVVLDEFGATSGLLTIEDIVEEIVGEISDEHDEDRPSIEAIDERTSVLDGRLSIADVNDQLGTALPEREVDTIGGFVFAHLNRIPRVGDAFAHQGWKFTVVEMDGRRVARVEVHRID